MKGKPDSQKLYQIAEEQAGYFTAKEAHSVGYSWERLSEYASNGKFQRIENGVYRLRQFPVNSLEEYFIALLKAGEKAVISHESALVVYDLSDAMPGVIHVTIPKTRSRRRTGLSFHTKKISEEEITVHSGLRVTRIPRTIIDLLESGYDFGTVKEAVIQAVKRGMVSEEELLEYSKGKSSNSLKLVKQLWDGDVS